MLFGGNKRIQELEAENANLKQWVEYLKGLDAIKLNQLVAKMKAEASQLATYINDAKAELTGVRTAIVETNEIALLQEVGIYQYRHPLDDAIAYQSKLKQLKESIKAYAKDGAVDSASGWTVNNSAKEGAKMTRDLSKLMLRAYNAEAESIVRTLRPYALDSAISRLDKTRETIAKLGDIVKIRITDKYHDLRVKEIELTADYLVKTEEEKERLRETRARQREEEKALREFEAERQRLQKEQNHYLSVLAKLKEKGDTQAILEIESKLIQLESSIKGLVDREANIRAGYVYIISNFGSFGERMVKIGLTRRLDPMDRVRELGDASVPFNFDVHALIFSEDAVSLENNLHSYFSEKRVNLVNQRREYFYATPTEVRNALESIGGQKLLEFHEVPEAAEWRASNREHSPMDKMSNVQN